MKRFLILALAACFSAAPAFAQDPVQTGAESDTVSTVQETAPAASADTAMMDDAALTTAAPDAPTAGAADVSPSEAYPAPEAATAADVTPTTAEPLPADAAATAEPQLDTVADTGDDEAPAYEAESVTGTIVSIDRSDNEITVRDETSQTDRRIDVDPNVMSSTSLAVGDSVTIRLSGGGKRAYGVSVQSGY